MMIGAMPLLEGLSDQARPAELTISTRFLMSRSGSIRYRRLGQTDARTTEIDSATLRRAGRMRLGIVSIAQGNFFNYRSAHSKRLPKPVLGAQGHRVDESQLLET